MARRSKQTETETVDSTSRKRTLRQGETFYAIVGTKVDDGSEEQLSTAKNAPGAVSLLEALTTLTRKSHRELCIKKVSICTLANGELVE